MKSTKTTRGLKSFTAAITLLGLFVAIPISRADDDKETKIKIKNGDNGDDAKIKIKNGEDSKLKIKGDRVKVKGKAARDLLKPEVTSAWVDGYTVPNEYHTQFTEIPVVKEDNVVLRYYNGRAYYVNSDNWTIVRVTEIDPSFEASSDSSVWVEGYVVPQEQRTRFVELPNPDAGMTVRYYNNTAYYMNPEYQIVRTVRLAE